MQKNIKKREQRLYFKQVLENNIKTQAQFKEEYEKIFKHTIAQSTISEYFRDFCITKGENGEYYMDVEDEVNDTVASCCSYVSHIHTDFFQLVVKCEVGKEKELCEALMKKFSKNLQSLIPAYGSVMIVCKSENNARRIRKYFKRYIKQKSSGESDS